MPESASSTAASAWIAVVSNSGTALSSGPHQQHDLGAAQDHRLAPRSTSRSITRGRRARGRLHPALHQFVVDDPVHDGAVGRLGHQHVQAEAPLQAPLVEILLHGEGGAEQADAAQPGA